MKTVILLLVASLAIPAWAQESRPDRSSARNPESRRAARRATGGPKEGDKAPDFRLKDAKGSAEVALSSFRDKKPVVLIFGSYT